MGTGKQSSEEQQNQQVQDAQQKKAQQVKTLAASDPQFRDAFPLAAVNEAKRQPGVRLAQAVQIVMEGYADRPALGQRARELVTDPQSGRKTLWLLPRFETITYRELWRRARSLASALHHDGDNPLAAGDFVCILGFTSPDYAALLLANIHLGAVNVPLQTSAPVGNHLDIIAETEARVLAAGIDYLDAGVKAVLAAAEKGVAPRRLLVLDYDARDDDQRERLQAARERLQQAACEIAVDSFGELVERGAALPPAPLFVAGDDEDPLAWLFYTSGSTGTPKGAIFTQKLAIQTWLAEIPTPVITLSFMPMAHLVGNGYLLLALASGGTSYCSPKADLSTLFEDFSLARPTMSSLVPRVCELFHHHYLGEVDRRIADGADAAAVGDEIKREMREQILGGRLLSVGCGSASLAPETYAFMESMLDMHMPIGYSSTEIAGGTVLVDWKVQRPPVIDYKLDDVPELGYFSSDKPYPRGELLVKSSQKMGGYYKQPDLTAEKYDEEGFYRTGDIMAELGPDHLVFVDRRNNVLKLSQGEFVAISKLEALYVRSPEIRQIYIYGTSERAYLLAVVVPSEALVAELGDDGEGVHRVKAAIRQALNRIAEEGNLNGYEVPRDFIVETEPFSLRNGLLTEVGKHQRPKLKQRYDDSLEQLYVKLAQERLDDLRELRASGAERPVLETVIRALQASLGIAVEEVRAQDQFGDLGGDSLTALEFSKLLADIFAVEVPVGVIINPAGSVQAIADYIDAARSSDAKRASFASVHGEGVSTIPAGDFKLEKFIDADIISNALSLPHSKDCQTVLLTGATGYLGRFLALSWLQRMAKSGGKLILVARGGDADSARRRVEAVLDTDPELIEHFRALAADHLEVVAGDLGAPGLGLDDNTWNRLAQTVDLIVHCGAHVNHMLPYNQLFPANVAGTAELIRLALTTELKRVDYISTLGVSILGKGGLVDEDSDIRQSAPSAELNDHYANGYNVSKWASEVLLREANEQFGLPVSIFRPGMILAHSHYRGQLNVPDMFTRLLFSLAATGVAPATFYAQDISAGRPGGRYEGFSVDFLADTITAIGAADTEGYHSYNLSSPTGEEGVGLDEFVDWIIEAGCNIERVDNYDQWLSRFETAMNALSEQQRQQSLLALIAPYRQPQAAGSASRLQSDRFCAAARAVGCDIPRLSADLIHKYVADLRYLNLL